MRILKYLFLLVLLSFVAVTIFIATQKGEYTVEKSKIINSPKSTVFNFVNDYRNWGDFSTWITDDPTAQITYSNKTIGSGASFSWQGKSGSGDVRTYFINENDSISQKMNFDNTTSSVFWSFKDTVGGTKVTWKTVGSMNFSMKVYNVFNGGINKIIGTMYEKSLANLDKILDFEINTFDIKVDGLVKKDSTFYLRQSFTSKISNVTKNSRIVFRKIINFCDQNNIERNGNPFLLYHTYDLINDVTRVSFCVPIKNKMLTSAGSDILTGELKAFDAVKTTLTGDYSHSKKAIDKTIAYVNANTIDLDVTFSFLEIYKVSKLENKSPSKWVTEIYFPIKPKVIPVRIYVPVKKVEEVKIPISKIIKEEEPSEF
ncbi:effector-binding domain-containing protein [Flavobacterium segetis]|uniref:Effector-binding domain-containing protein n=1 Tax=Flavobacterium segetis TaxID=271157 RepID=A0A1M5E1F7_9FLAO|nr:SRPBCC family protein [Flavobacterium segetis]SHF72954.1 effector-binding domain-containing protein [Flavobacterium segetis]